MSTKDFDYKALYQDSTGQYISCEQFEIDWKFSCPNALINKDFEECFLHKNLSSSPIIPCETGYIFDQTIFTSTVVTQWDLVCERSHIEPIISSIFMTGLFLGVFIFGPIIDRYGRCKARLEPAVAIFQRKFLFVRFLGR